MPLVFCPSLGYGHDMLTVLMDCGSDDRRLAATLAPLVAGAVEGVVREVVLFDRGMRNSSRRVADHAGCRIVDPKEFRSAIKASKGDWLLLLEPGARLSPGWIEAITDHVNDVALGRARSPAARFMPSPGDRPGFFQRVRRIRTALAEGFLLPKPQAIGRANSADTLEKMARGVAVTALPATIKTGVAATHDE